MCKGLSKTCDSRINMCAKKKLIKRITNTSAKKNVGPHERQPSLSVFAVKLALI